MDEQILGIIVEGASETTKSPPFLPSRKKEGKRINAKADQMCQELHC
jgi:hypothetical protein